MNPPVSEPACERGNLDAFLRPTSIAVIGASDDPSRIGGRTISNLKRGGFAGAIYPVNPGRDTVQGLPAYRSILDVPDTIDCVIVALPGDLVVPAIRAAAEKQVKAAVIFSAGFNEAGPEGVERQRQLVEIAKDAGMRIVGPNCLGVFNAANGAWASFTTQFQERTDAPTLGMVSQSGGSAAHILRLAQDRGMAIGTFITTGNEADVDFGDGLMALALDDGIKVILGYIEGIRDAARLIAGLEAARRGRKPVIVLKVGRTSAGAQAAASHTASLAGEDRVYDAIFRQYGVYRAVSTEELLDVAAVAAQVAAWPAGNRLGVVTISGGMGAQVADAASDAGLVLPPAPDHTQERLRALCPVGSPTNPVDITAQLSTDPHLLAASMRAMLESGCYDSLLAFFGVYAGVPALSAIFLEDLKELRRDFPEATIALCVVCPSDEAARYAAAGFPVFEEPARAVRAISALHGFAEGFARTSAPVSADAPVIAARAYDEAVAKALLRQAGIPSPREIVVAHARDVGSASATLSFPVALKILSADILHKTEVGGVKLAIACAAEAAIEAEAMVRRVAMAAPDARIAGLLLSEMAPAGVELIVGARRDPLFGPLVMVGLGGVTAELLGDVAIRLAPVSEAEAAAMLRSLRCFPLLDGYRGAPPTDIPAAAAAVAALSRLAAANADTIETIEINPLRVLEEGRGVLALDGVITLQEPQA
ncbi:acetate--CoA ligase family protein [Sphingomonas profundi]|uniref:acetate--CoA ligase family protein n=1 Tax=Alterirhizorhabdus profundi TaxID=2681549 RepID=UPI0012E7573B|nr:acetate--CoA ligase family protein [Sphingomonas profundi]